MRLTTVVRNGKRCARGLVLLVGAASLFSGCDKGSHKNSTDAEGDDDTLALNPLGYPASCAGLHDKLIDCRLLADGPLSCSDSTDASVICTLACFVDASCATLDALYCGDIYPDDALNCVLRCLGGDGEIYICPASDTRIPRQWLCDGDPDCPEGEDEADCGAPFPCASGDQEIPLAGRCDGASDCGDASDEADCPLFQCGAPDETIPLSWQCDYYADCTDGSDEANCPDAFICATADEVIAEEWRCDGEPDCADGSDEVGCALFNCVSGDESIRAEYQCDLMADCADGSDEAGCAALLCDAS